MSIKQDVAIAGPLGYPSKMPGTSYGISAHHCKTGSKLAAVEGSVCHDCYALKGNYLYPSIKQSHEAREKFLASPQWVDAIVRMLNHMHTPNPDGSAKRGRNGPIQPGWHRWHDSGDLQSVEHVAKICEVARKTPTIKHWLPTRELAMVLAYRDQGGIIPDNLVVRVSATMVDGEATKAWPTVSTVYKNDAPRGRKCPAPTQEGKCGDCRACWNPEVKNVSYHKH